MVLWVPLVLEPGEDKSLVSAAEAALNTESHHGQAYCREGRWGRTVFFFFFFYSPLSVFHLWFSLIICSNFFNPSSDQILQNNSVGPFIVVSYRPMMTLPWIRSSFLFDVFFCCFTAVQTNRTKRITAKRSINCNKHPCLHYMHVHLSPLCWQVQNQFGCGAKANWLELILQCMWLSRLSF